MVMPLNLLPFDLPSVFFFFTFLWASMVSGKSIVDWRQKHLLDKLKIVTEIRSVLHSFSFFLCIFHFNSKSTVDSFISKCIFLTFLQRHWTHTNCVCDICHLRFFFFAIFSVVSFGLLHYF